MENSNVNEDSGMKVDPIGDSSSPVPQPPVDERLQKALDKALYAGGRPAAQKIIGRQLEPRRGCDRQLQCWPESCDLARRCFCIPWPAARSPAAVSKCEPHPLSMAAHWAVSWPAS